MEDHTSQWLQWLLSRASRADDPRLEALINRAYDNLGDLCEAVPSNPNDDDWSPTSVILLRMLAREIRGGVEPWDRDVVGARIGQWVAETISNPEHLDDWERP